ncbi:MAG: teichuronic acid biosynthesis glycosyltransferase TuaC [Thermosipho sp. (in: thermotogales)]|nr:teichuronic acid biosynthesis glycosyltransferase TuaC [Thermosipho sp. (in: thermotogales)]MDN5325261.1 teichuronic acid biosynthesis glycosyltransferase TuaC [Thermosipho sp. (in: thermotogales)]
MKIFMFFGEIPIEYGGKKAGGAAKVAWEISKELSKNHEVYLYPLHDYSEKKVLNVNVINRNRKKIVFSNLPKVTKVKEYYKFFKKMGFETKYAIRFALSNSVLEKYIIKYVEKIKPDIIHIHEISAERMFIINLSIKLNIPTVLTSHGVKSDLYEFENISIPKSLEDRKKFENYVYNYIISNENNYITAVSSKIREKIIRYYNIQENKIKTIFNGINEKFINDNNDKELLRKKYNIPIDKKILLTVGTLSKRKNQILVLKALKKMPETISKNILYILIGEGEEKENLVEFVNKNNLNEKVLFLGNKFSQELIDYYHLSDYFILTSLSEAMPLVYLEALASGLPIITIKGIEGVSDLYDEKCFELAEDYNNIIEAIIKAFSKDWDKEYIINYSKKFLWNNITKEYEKLYMEMIN